MLILNTHVATEVGLEEMAELSMFVLTTKINIFIHQVMVETTRKAGMKKKQ